LNIEFNQSLKSLRGKSFLSIADFDRNQIISLIELAIDIKRKKTIIKHPQKTLGLIFDKSSTRTRVSFHTAMNRLSGCCIELNPQTSQIGRGEPIRDTARVLSGYLDAIAIRTFDQSKLDEYKKWSSIPIINALTDIEHPCQILADFLTIKEEFGSFQNINLTYIGDSNNVANSLILCGAILGVRINIACPETLNPDKKIIQQSDLIQPDNLRIINDPKTAVKGANILYTDVWASMGQEKEASEKEILFKGFCLDEDLLKIAEENCILLHCLPAYRGKEITDNIIESSASRIFNQSENRLFAQQALLSVLLD